MMMLYLSFGFLVAVVIFIVLQRFYGLVGNPIKVLIAVVKNVIVSLQTVLGGVRRKVVGVQCVCSKLIMNIAVAKNGFCQIITKDGCVTIYRSNTLLMYMRIRLMLNRIAPRLRRSSLRRLQISRMLTNSSLNRSRKNMLRARNR